ncbi:hypothetical protein [Mucilaginibacter sp. OK098]|uniref:hypothetical protein n=1 Tax=Mucilaginibacter sp. OK098 TaxID=1855297 RepID=UPI000920EB63|nr:hypothetical protein [Mucilaginibacter sp. OK098]SHM95650.1 hypothetical protein SAMN05216524_104280 [Mucilaginibacter sp. OK098]
MNILITAANSAEAHRLKNQLNTENIILGDYLELPAFMLKSANMIRLPNPISLSYTHEMLTLCLDKEIKKVYALREEELTNLVKAEQLFGEYGIEVVHGS